MLANDELRPACSDTSIGGYDSLFAGLMPVAVGFLLGQPIAFESSAAFLGLLAAEGMVAGHRALRTRARACEGCGSCVAGASCTLSEH